MKLVYNSSIYTKPFNIIIIEHHYFWTTITSKILFSRSLHTRHW